MSECCENDPAVRVESCFCHKSLDDIREFVTMVCYYNCKICDLSCTSVADIRSHVVENHLHRTCGTEGVMFHSELQSNGSAVLNNTSIIQMPRSELASTAASNEAPASEDVGLMSKEFSTISESSCDFLTSASVSHSADPSSLQPLHSTIAGQTLQLFVNNQEIQLNIPHGFNGDVAGLPASVQAGLCVDSSHVSSLVQPADIVKSTGPLAVQSGSGQTVESSGEKMTEMYICDSCGTVFNGVGIVDHMLRVHGVRVDSVNVAGSSIIPRVANVQHVPSACTRSIDVIMPPNTMSIGTQAQLSKKPGRKRKVVTDVATSAGAEEQMNKHIASTAEKDIAAAVAVKTLGIERLTSADGENGLSKRRIQPPRALVEDYHIHRLRQSKPRTRSTPAAPELLCSFGGCKAAFRQQDAVDYHVKCHADGELFCCPECSTLLPDWSSMLPHLWTVHGIDLYGYQCGQCKFRADNSVTVTEHAIAQHSNRKHVQPFLCSVCGQTFRKANLRNQHEKSHSSRRLFSRQRTQSELVAFRRCVCDLCKRSFANKKSLNKHVEVTVIHTTTTLQYGLILGFCLCIFEVLFHSVVPVFRSTPKSRPNNMGQMSVRPSTKSFSDSDEIWYVGRGR